MKNLLIRIIVFLAAIYITDWLLVGIAFSNLESYGIVGVALVAINTFIKPVIRFFTFPITLMTLGLFPLILNTICILVLASYIDGFKIIANYLPMTFAWAFAFSMILSIVNIILEKAVKIIT